MSPSSKVHVFCALILLPYCQAGFHQEVHDETGLLTSFMRKKFQMNTSLISELSRRKRGSKEALPGSIPRKLLFNHRINLFEADGDLSKHEKILRANLKHTVKVFQDTTGVAPDVEMWDDKKCLTALQMLDIPEAKALAFDFATEILGMIRSDLCRLVMLYSSGGYYFDTDIVLLASMEKRIHPQATFVTVRAVERYGGGFFQAFLATTPKHPVIERSLKKFKAWYDIYWAPGQDQNQLRKDTAHGNIGCALLERSFQEWCGSKSQDPLLVHQSGHVSQFFDEGQFQVNQQAGEVLASDLSTMVPRHEEQWSKEPCDWCAIDKRTNTVVLVSRIYNRFKDEACETANSLGISGISS